MGLRHKHWLQSINRFLKEIIQLHLDTIFWTNSYEFCNFSQIKLYLLSSILYKGERLLIIIFISNSSSKYTSSFFQANNYSLCRNPSVQERLLPYNTLKIINLSKCSKIYEEIPGNIENITFILITYVLIDSFSKS